MAGSASKYQPTSPSMRRTGPLSIGVERELTVRIVLLGISEENKSKVCQMIFNDNRPIFTNSKQCEKVTGKMKAMSVTVVKTPDLFAHNLTEELLKVEIKHCMSLCEPGPHILLLILNPALLRKGTKQRLMTLLSVFGKEAFSHSMVLTSCKVMEKSTNAMAIIKECGGRHQNIQETNHASLSGQIETLVNENGWRFLSYTGDTQRGVKTERKPKVSLLKLNLVLCGRRKAEKILIGNTILGLNTSDKSTSHPGQRCVNRQREVCGRSVTLVEMPALNGTCLTQEKEMRETLRCVSLCDPPGVHAFLFVAPEGPLSDEDKGELNTIQKTFFSSVDPFLIVLCKQQSKSKFCKGILKCCGLPYQVLRGTSDVPLLIDAIEEIASERGDTAYTSGMYLNAHADTKLLNYIKMMEAMSGTVKAQKSPDGLEDDSLRIVLLGKTGVGKSATGNTILEKQVFKEGDSDSSSTRVCQKESAEVNGRQVTVVDTPGLFDTDIDEEEIRKEIGKCISMAAPGPHVFILVLNASSRFTKEERESVKIIEEIFGKDAPMYSIVLFSKQDQLKTKSIDEYVQNAGAYIQHLIGKYGGRYHSFNNSDKTNPTQVADLLGKIDTMVTVNGGNCYTNEMFENVERALNEQMKKIIKEKEEEIYRQTKQMGAEHEEQIKQLQKNLDEASEREWAERNTMEEQFKRREQQIQKLRDEDTELSRELQEELMTKREAFQIELREKEKKHDMDKKQALLDLRAAHEKERQGLVIEAKKKARAQAESEFRVLLEKRVSEAREDGIKVAQSNMSCTARRADRWGKIGSSAGLPGFVVGSQVGALVGTVEDMWEWITKPTTVRAALNIVHGCSEQSIRIRM